MESLVCIALVAVPIWLGFRVWGAGRRREQLEQYAWSLQNCECSADGYYLRVSFPEMSAESKYTSDDPAFRACGWYAVRRTQAGVWETMLREEETDNYGTKERTMPSAPEWKSVREDFQPRIETAYQRFIHRS